jgi:raffinose/stachyose/melibiose transport system permease protein
VLGGAFFRGLINSLLIVSVSLLLVVFISAAAAFAFARLDFKINTLIFTSVLACLIVPQHTTLIPIYTLTTKLGLYDTLYALLGPYVAFSLPVTIFILTQFMRDVPKELFESAIIDGASHGRVFFFVYLGVAKGAMATVAIFNAITLWNEFLFAYILTGRPETRTLPLTVFDFQGQYTSNIPAILASLSLATIPLFLAYLFFQEQLVKGVLAGAVKS